MLYSLNSVFRFVTSVLRRIVAPKNLEDRNISLHDHTYGITSDPLTQFSVVMSALIHDGKIHSCIHAPTFMPPAAAANLFHTVFS